MVAFANEKPLSLKAAADFASVTVKTVRIWSSQGVGGRRLETFKLGGKVYTTLEAIQRFATVPEQVQYAPPSVVARDNAEVRRLLRERHG